MVCSSEGEGHGLEKPAAGVRYKGREFFFCNAKEVGPFKKDPEAFMPPVLPRKAPELNLRALDGSALDLKGKVVLLDFWATWCKPCVAAMPSLSKLHTKLADRGFSVVGVSIDQDGLKKVKPFADKHRLPYPLALDSTKDPLWQKFGVRQIPAMFLVKDGQILMQWKGKVDEKVLEDAIRERLTK